MRFNRLGPYEILEPLGAGGMGEVYRATDPRLGRHVAIKILPEHLARDARAMARFEREARAVAALSHPGILAIYDFGSDEGLSYIVTELLEGETLRNRLLHGAMPWRRAVEIAVALCDALATAHAKGVVHRDLTPGNIFLTADDRAKILDFGVARYEAEEQRTRQHAVTDTGVILGTIGYMSPEQVLGQRVDERSDLFSLGCVLYEMVTGNQPFARPTTVETMAAVLHAEPPLAVMVPPELSRVLSRCLEKNTHQRFQAAQDLQSALQSLLSGSAAVTLAASAATIESIAVLPFASAGGDPEADYLSEGITESIINSLSQLPRLRVVPRNTVFRYRQRDADSQAIGRELKVRTVLTGRIAARGARLIVSTELTDVVEETQLWGERYMRQLSDIFALEEEIARQIVEKLRLRLGDDHQRLGKRHTDDPEAYRLYLHARHYFLKATTEGFTKAIELFGKAIETDPTYALAYAGLADVYCVMGYADLLPPGEAMPRAKAAARRALEIDEQLADAHAALATILFHYEWNWAAAEREFKRAIELNPNHAGAYDWYGIQLTTMGRFDEGMALLRRALQLDPLTELFQFHVGLNLLMRRQVDAAIDEFLKALKLNPNDAWSLMNLADALIHRKEYAEAVAACDRAIAIYGPAFAPAKAVLCHAYVGLGRSTEAADLVSDLAELSQRAYVSGYLLAWAHLSLGQTEQALDCLEKACDERSVWMVWLKTDLLMDTLSSEPRYQALLRRMAFP